MQGPLLLSVLCVFLLRPKPIGQTFCSFNVCYSTDVRMMPTRTVVRDPEAIFSAIILRRTRRAIHPNRSLYGMAQRAIFCWHRLPFQPRGISQAVRALQQCHHSFVSVQEESVSRPARRLLRTL